MEPEETDGLQIVAPHPMSDRITAARLYIVCDAPGVGNGSHSYKVFEKFEATTSDQSVPPDRLLLALNFQHGPIGEVGINGVLTGTLLQILIHHLSGFQSGPYKSRETAIVVTKLEEALQWSKQRELERAQRGVLGAAAK